MADHERVTNFTKIFLASFWRISSVKSISFQKQEEKIHYNFKRILQLNTLSFNDWSPYWDLMRSIFIYIKVPELNKTTYFITYNYGRVHTYMKHPPSVFWNTLTFIHESYRWKDSSRVFNDVTLFNLFVLFKKLHIPRYL